MPIKVNSATTPTAVTAPAREDAWLGLQMVLLENLHDPDCEAVQVVVAAYAAHRLKQGPPPWLLVVGPSGSSKTLVVETMEGLPGTTFIDSLTPQSLLSGQLTDRGQRDGNPTNRRSQGEPSPSLLHRLGTDAVMVMADFSTVLGMKPDRRDAILADFRRIYDGHFSKEFGTAERLEERKWRGRLTLLGAVTPEVDRARAMQAMGERFLRVRVGRAGGVEAGLAAMAQDKKALAEALRGPIHALLHGLPTVAPEIPDQWMRRLASLGEIVALGRATVQRNRSHEIVAPPEPEGNTRVCQQLAQLARGWALVIGRDAVGAEDYAVAVRAAWDSLPPARSTVLRALASGRNAYAAGLGHTLAERALEDLEAVGLVTLGNEVSLTPGNRTAALSDKARDLLIGAGQL